MPWYVEYATFHSMRIVPGMHLTIKIISKACMQALVRAQLSVLLNALHTARWFSGCQRGVASVRGACALQLPVNIEVSPCCSPELYSLPLVHK